MSSTNMLNSDKGQNLLPPPAIFLSEATSDGEDTGDDSKQKAQAPRLVKCDAVLTDVEYSSDEDDDRKICASPVAVNCSSESQVVERIFEPDTPLLNDELTDTENICASDDDLLCDDSVVKENNVDVCEEGVVTISDHVKVNSRNRNRFSNISKNVDPKHSRRASGIGPNICNRDDESHDKNYLAPVNRLAKKKKRKGKLLLDSCLTDTEDVDVPSDVDDSNRVMKKDISYNLFPSEKEEQEYTNRIKHTSSLRASEKFTLVEFLTNKLEDGSVTDTDDIVYSECEDLLETIKETEYELDFCNQVDNKETVLQTSNDRKAKKKRNTRRTCDSADSDEDETKFSPKFNQRFDKSREDYGISDLAICKVSSLRAVDDSMNALTDTEDLNYSDGECSSSRPKCPTPDVAFLDNSTVLHNESLTIMQALEVLSDADPMTDCEELFLTPSPRRSKKPVLIPPGVRINDLTDTEELFLSDGNPGHSEFSDTGGDSCSETDVEMHSNFEDMDELRYHAPSVTPDCLRSLDNTYISNVEGSEAYLKQIKSSKPRSPVPPVLSSGSPYPAQETDSEEIITEDETAEEFCYNRALTPSNYYEKFNLEDESSVIHEQSTRSFQTDGAESLHIKDPSYQQEPVTDSEEVPLID